MRKLVFLSCIVLLSIGVSVNHIPALAQGTVPLNSVRIDFNLVGSGFDTPVDIAHAGDGSGRLFVVEKPGKIMILENGQRRPTAFLNIVSLVNSAAYERGLLGLAFHPKYEENGYFYVYYTAIRGRTQGDITIARYQVSDDPNMADPQSGKILLQVPHARGNHNGGQLAFGPDGYLYAGLGDGGGGGDPDEQGQNPATLLGKILRLDVDNGDPYGIPENNPFADGSQGAPEVWAWGLRNPWRFSFDRETGDLYIADVGQNQWEEIDFQAADSEGGLNYGWDEMEGFHCFSEHPNCNTSQFVQPIFEYDRSLGISVTGGYVYRGEQFPNLNGIYFFSDFGTGNFWATRADANGKWETVQLPVSLGSVSSFGEDEAGEVYIASMGAGEIYQLVEAQ